MPLQKQLYQTLAADSAIEKSLIKFDSKDPILLLNKLLSSWANKYTSSSCCS